MTATQHFVTLLVGVLTTVGLMLGAVLFLMRVSARLGQIVERLDNLVERVDRLDPPAAASRRRR